MRKNTTIRAALLATLVIVLTIFGFSTQASADTMTNYYNVDVNGVCRMQGHSGAFLVNPYDPYSWTCVDFSVSFSVPTSVGASITFAGGLDIQAWCQRYVPGSCHTVLAQRHGLEVRPQRSP